MTLEESIARLGVNWSIELTPREITRHDDLRAHLPAGTRVYVTALPKAKTESRVAAAKRLAELGLTPVPHIPARRLASEDELNDTVARFTGEAGVSEVLLIAGDDAEPAGPFDSTLPVLESGVLEAAGVKAIAVGAHPTGHPVVDDATLRQAADAKIAYARRSGAAFRMVTQFCFDAAPVIAWRRDLAARGGDLPVHVGLPGLVSVRKLARFARLLGVWESLRVLIRHGGLALRLARVATPDAVVAGLARHLAEDDADAFAGLHYYAFGSLEATAAWANAVAEGRFDLADDGKRFTVRDA